MGDYLCTNIRKLNCAGKRDEMYPVDENWCRSIPVTTAESFDRGMNVNCTFPQKQSQMLVFLSSVKGITAGNIFIESIK